MDEPAGGVWSDQVGGADWIEPRLRSDGPLTVTSVVPAGFAGYARILHPARGPVPGNRAVRWAEIAAWNGLPLRGDSQFHSVALARQRPARPAPWSGQPAQGTLDPPGTAVLASILRDWTATPDQCWFCLWAGYSYSPGPGESAALIAVRDGPASEDGPGEDGPGEDPLQDATAWPSPFHKPVPQAVREGPRVELAHHEYLLYTGPVEAALGAEEPAYAPQSANLWWPQDHAWCVASEVGTLWTYVGGPAALIDQLVADQRIEALRASPGDAVGGVEPWITDAAVAAAEQLLISGEAAIAASVGTFRAYLRRPSRLRRGLLRTEWDDGSGSGGSGRTWLSRGTRKELRDEIMHRLAFDVISTVED